MDRRSFLKATGALLVGAGTTAPLEAVAGTEDSPKRCRCEPPDPSGLEVPSHTHSLPHPEIGGDHSHSVEIEMPEHPHTVTCPRCGGLLIP